jgi:glutamate--cysteine ligase
MEACDYRWIAARNQRSATDGPGPEGIGNMAFAVASQPDQVRPAESELASSSAAAQYITDSCLSDGPVGRVGLEVEAHCYDPADPHRRPTWGEINDVLKSLPAMPGGSVVTVEPGGAVELSGPPIDGVVPAIEAMTTDQTTLRNAFAAAGLGLVLLGADPLRPAKRINPGARYRAMEQFFKASRTGVAGAAMMTSTASVQVNLDAGPAPGWADRVRLAHALGPTLVAIAANSPLLGGAFSGWRSTRQRVWSQLDSARCGPVLTASGDDPGTDWARYALKAPVMLVHSPEAVPVLHYLPFADWADGRELLGGRRPTRHDLEYHLTTLFPPVRPRQWLEIRYLDSVPNAIWPAVVFTLVSLLDDPVAADIAAEAVEPVATSWDIAARVGLGDQRLYTAANRLVAAAADLAPPALDEAMQRLVAAVEWGRCPADEFSDQVIGNGIEATVGKLALGET